MPIPLGILAVAGAGAAGAASSFDLLQTTLITTNTASVTFSNLNTYSDYKHLQLRVVARTNDAGTLDTQLFYINSDTSSSYGLHRLRGSGGVPVSDGFANQSVGYLGWAAGAGAASNIFVSTICDILDFSNTNKNKTLRVYESSAIPSFNNIRLTSVGWFKTNAITSLTIFASGSYVSGTRLSLYGIK